MSNQELIVGLTEAEKERMSCLAETSANLRDTAQRILQDGWQSKVLGGGTVDNRVALSAAMATCGASGILVTTAGDIDCMLMENMLELKMADIAGVLKHQAADVIAEMRGYEPEEPEEASESVIEKLGIAMNKLDNIIQAI